MTTSVSNTAPPAAAALESARKIYGRGTNAVAALDSIDVAFARGTFTAVMGPSGSGKSTLLHCAAGLDRLTDGTARLAGTDLAGLSEAALTRLRRTRIGFVFQAFNLVSCAERPRRTSCCRRDWHMSGRTADGWPRWSLA